MYVLPLEDSCIKAMKYSAATKAPVLECDVKRMLSRPDWLDGVPSLLDRKSGLLYKGTNCLKKLQQLCTVYPVRQI